MTRKRKIPDFIMFRAGVLNSVRGQGALFTSPTDDWAPVFITASPKRFLTTALMDILATPQTKAVIPGVIKAIFKEEKPIHAALVMSAWMSFVKPVDPFRQLCLEMLDTFGVSTAPNKTELVLVEAASKKGEDEVWSADIKRSKDKPPVLAPWRKWEGTAGGRFGHALKDAFNSLR
jgi:hypothetical protein